MIVPDRVVSLVNRFQENEGIYRSNDYKEAHIRQDFIDPFFEALGWDLRNEQNTSEIYREVIFEDAIKIGGSTKAPDYCFQIGGNRKFFVETTRPSVNLAESASVAFQVRRYGWSAKLPVSILTDFEEFAVYNCRIIPNKMDKSTTARSLYLKYTEYADRWEDIYSLFSREAVLAGSLEQYADEKKPKRGSATVDTAFLKEIESWRERLAVALFTHNPDLKQRELNFAVQMTINRLIFLRICEDRGIEPYEQLRSLTQHNQIYEQLCVLVQSAEARYNSGLFHFKPEKDRPELDEFTLNLVIPDQPLQHIIQNLYYPDSPYEFSVIPIEILGQVYEQFLGQVIRLTPEQEAIVEDKPEVRKAGGVYYTPTYIVDYIVQNTVGRLLEGKTPKQAEKIRVLDPACGSGSFLIGAYQFLLNWYLQQYLADPQKHKKKLYQGISGDWRLTSDEKKRILLNHIHGVDIDLQAVETTKLSLLLKVLEGESQETLTKQLSLLQERALLDLEKNIKCGNSLIGSDYYENVQSNLLDEEELYHINVFDWEEGFPAIMRSGGFDVVIGNPPYIDSEWMTKHLPDQRKYCRKHYRSASGNWDLFCVFSEKAMQLCKSKGLSSFIVPNKLGSASYAAETRCVLSIQNNLIAIRDYANVPVFSVAVYPIVYFVRKEEPKNKQTTSYEKMEVRDSLVKIVQSRELEQVNYFHDYKRPWAIFSDVSVSHTLDILSKLKTGNPCLEEIASVQGAATVSEAYEIQLLIREYESVEDTAFKIINSGTIDRYDTLWGRKKFQYIKKSYQKPIIHISDKFKLPKKRIQQAGKEKIIIAGMTKVLECFPDLEGSILAGKSTSVIQSTYDLKYLSAILNSKLMTFFYQNQFTGDALNGGYLRIGPPQLRILPICVLDLNKPANKVKHDRIISLVEQMLSLHKQLGTARTPQQKSMIQNQIKIADRQIDQLVYELYGLTEEEIAIVEGRA